MKIVILNGSPKGNEKSVTMHYMFYIEKLFPEHEFKPVNVGQLLTNMRIKDQTFQGILEDIKTADGVVWSFPIYTALIPAQLKKFIELLFENDSKEIYQDKYTIVLTTSMRFFDHTAHNYMHGILEDLGMKYVGFHSAEMFDFLKFDERKKFYIFFKHFLNAIETTMPISQTYGPIVNRDFTYSPSLTDDNNKIDSMGKRITLLTDTTDESSNLGKMVKKFKESFKNGVEVFNVFEIDMKGGCMGCCKCGLDNVCAYNDGFTEFFRSKIKNIDLLVNAVTITDRFFSYRFKMLYDRMFHNGHTPMVEGTQICYLVSGSLSQIGNLRQYITATSELGFGNLVDIVTDEFGTSEDIDDLIYNMAKKAIEFSEVNYVAPHTFMKEGGYKIFRDMVYGLPGAIFRMDRKFFKRRKMFDFPTKKKKARIGRFFIGSMLSSKKARKWFKGKLSWGMIVLFRRKLEKINLNKEKELLGVVNA